MYMQLDEIILTNRIVLAAEPLDTPAYRFYVGCYIKFVLTTLPRFNSMVLLLSAFKSIECSQYKSTHLNPQHESYASRQNQCHQSNNNERIISIQVEAMRTGVCVFQCICLRLTIMYCRVLLVGFECTKYAI